MRRRVTPWAAALVSLCVPALARANDGRTSSLSWVELPGAESCGGALAIARAVEQRIGRAALVSPATAAYSVEGRAERSGAGLRAVLVLRDRTGTALGHRELESEVADCTELREKVSLAVALMIDPDAVLNPPQALPTPAPAPSATGAPAGGALVGSTPASEAAPAITAAPVMAAATSSPPSHPPARPVVTERVEAPVGVIPAAPWALEPAASAEIGFGFMPSASVGALLATTLIPPRFWTMEFYGGVWASQTLAAGAGASARFTSGFGGLGLCPLRHRSGPLSVLLCAAAQVGFVNGEPSGFAAGHAGALPTVHLAPDAHLSLDLSRWISARAGGSVAVALLRSQFVFERSTGEQLLFDPPWLAATADLGFAVVLP